MQRPRGLPYKVCILYKVMIISVHKTEKHICLKYLLQYKMRGLSVLVLKHMFIDSFKRKKTHTIDNTFCAFNELMANKLRKS